MIRHSFRPLITEPIRAVLRRLVMAMGLFGEREIINHASAAAYAFLLSVVPALLLSLGLATLLLQPWPDLPPLLYRMVSTFFVQYDLPNAAPIIFSSSMGLPGTLFWVIGLLWSSSLFFATLRRGIKIIWVNSATANSKGNPASFIVETGGLGILISLLAAVEIAMLFLWADREAMLGHPILRTFLELAPFAALFLFTLACYLFLSPRRPRKRPALLYSILCIVIFMIFYNALQVIINAGQYTILYGVIGNIAKTLLVVFVYFLLFFLGACLIYIENNFDALLFGRHCRWVNEPGIPRMERVLFIENHYLRQRYGKTLATGDILFRAGDHSRNAFFVDDGEIGIYLPGKGRGHGELIATLKRGELFGEMASLLNEERSATAVALSKAHILEIPPEVFSYYLQSSPDASRGMIDVLAERLRTANLRRSS